MVSNGKFVEAGATSTKENIQSIDVKELMNMLEDKYADQKVHLYLVICCLQTDNCASGLGHTE